MDCRVGLRPPRKDIPLTVFASVAKQSNPYIVMDGRVGLRPPRKDGAIRQKKADLKEIGFSCPLICGDS